MNDLITVVVPIYNVEKYLSRCIDSIIHQTYQNLEIILVDDGSTDGCPEICDEYEKKDIRIKVIHKKNGGLSDARNAGIDNACGKYIGFVDSDDYIESDMYEQLYKNIKEYNCDIAICGVFIDYENGKIIDRVGKKRALLIMNREEGLIKLNNYTDFNMSACDKLYRMELWKNIRFPYGKISEDYYTTYKLFHVAQSSIFVPEPLYHYYQRSNSISRGKKINECYIEGSKDQLEYFRKNIPDLLYVALSSYAFAHLSTYNYYIDYGQNCPKTVKKKYKKVVRKNLSTIIKNSSLSKAKKIQAIIFSYSLFAYKIMYKIVRRFYKITEEL